VLEHATALADAIDDALPRWVERCVQLRLHHPTAEHLDAARRAGQAARDEVGAAVRRVLTLDIDEQRVNPLALLRDAVRYPTEVLRAAGAPAVDRDDFQRDRFPDDDYDLTPATWADIDPALAEPGITWSAAKAFTHKQRHSS